MPGRRQQIPHDEVDFDTASLPRRRAMIWIDQGIHLRPDRCRTAARVSNLVANVPIDRANAVRTAAITSRSCGLP